MRRADCKDVIEEVWNDSSNRSTPNGLVEGLKQCASALTAQSKSTFRRIPKRIKEKKEVLGRLIENDVDGQNGAEINKLRKEINELLDEEEVWWHQRSRVQQLGEGDRNTKYFHHRALERRKKNTINGLWNEEGLWYSSKESVAATAIAYFEDIYTTTHPTSVDEVTNLILAKVTSELNIDLICDFTMDEFRAALQQMHRTKAPGPDSMSAIFYRKYWDIVGFDAAKLVLNVLNSNAPCAEINRTNIALVPKLKNPSKMKDFRPISLNNVAYKLISKVLANRLEVVLPQIISENQSAFLTERLITDNILLAFELMHYLDHKKSRKDGYMAVKLDMSKTYD